MKREHPSDTYKELYYQIIDEVLNTICNAEPGNYCVKTRIDNISVQYAIERKFESYKEKARRYMEKEGNLDRHKLAACLCGAIIEVQPLCLRNPEGWTTINEIAAMNMGLIIVEYYMRDDFVKTLNVPKEEQLKIITHFENDFHMSFPETICDVKSYGKNLVNALFRSHSKCEEYYNGKECFRYDIWAYAKIFYHLELYNRKFMQDSYDRYLANH